MIYSRRYIRAKVSMLVFFAKKGLLMLWALQKEKKTIKIRTLQNTYTSRMALGYFESLESSCLPSSLQQLRQLFVMSVDTENLLRSSQEEHRTWARLNPKSLHSSALRSRPKVMWTNCGSKMEIEIKTAAGSSPRYVSWNHSICTYRH